MKISEKYLKLNEFASQSGIVIFGTGEDENIPACELRQAFNIEQKVYNRSFESMSIKDAVDTYIKVAAPLNPDTVLLHMGACDLELFSESSELFDNKYRELINTIKSQNKKCRISIVSLKNYNSDKQIEEINKHLKYISDSERCEYVDISTKKVWNPQTTKDTVSFVYSMGFVHSLKNQRPIFDLVKIFFCYE